MKGLSTDLGTVFLFGRARAIFSMSGAKPWSNKRSASSRTKNLTLDSLLRRPDCSMWSSRRPGVWWWCQLGFLGLAMAMNKLTATRMSARRVVSRKVSDFMLVPPITHWTPRPVFWISFSASAWICCAKSRVGETISAETVPPGGSLALRRWMIGSRKATVFPVPVFARANLN